jgi:hypothetical protein
MPGDEGRREYQLVRELQILLSSSLTECVTMGTQQLIVAFQKQLTYCEVTITQTQFLLVEIIKIPFNFHSKLSCISMQCCLYCVIGSMKILPW